MLYAMAIQWLMNILICLILTLHKVNFKQFLSELGFKIPLQIECWGVLLYVLIVLDGVVIKKNLTTTFGANSYSKWYVSTHFFYVFL